MTGQVPEHTVFDELAAGYVLHALEPADEQRFLRHAEQCARCQQTLAEFRMVAATLAETAPPAEPSARLGERIMAVARADLAEPGPGAAPPADSGSTYADTAPRDGAAPDDDTAPGDSAAPDNGPAPGDQTAPDNGAAPGGQTAPGDSAARSDRTAPDDRTVAGNGTAPPAGPAAGRVVPLRRRPGRGTSGRRWQKPAVAAAAAVLLAAGGIWAGLAATSGGPPQPLAACAHPNACPQVMLTSATTHRTAAKVVINDAVAWIEPSAMRANPADEIYVLWQVTGAPVPLAVGSFDVKAGASTPIRIGALPAPYHGTQAFAVSLEHGRTIPPRPSKPVAAGKVS